MLTVDDVRQILSDFSDRCDRARLVGGVAHMEVVERGLRSMPGYWFDWQTHYWIPVGVTLEGGSA